MMRLCVMPTLRTPMLSLLGVLLFVSAAPAQTVLPSNTMLDRYGLVRAWWNQATTSAQRDKVQYLVVDEEMVYVQSTSGITTAFDAETGERRWAVQLGRQDDPSFPAASNDEMVLIAIGVQLYALDKRSGDILWQFRVPSVISTSPAMDGQHVYLGCQDGSLYAFSLALIEQSYRGGELPPGTYQTMRWKYQTPAAIVAPPLPVPWQAAGGPVPRPTVNFADASGSLYSLLADERKLRFQFETDAAASAPLSHSQGYLFMPSTDFDLYCLSLGDGQLRWRFVTGAPIREKAAVIGDDVFVTPVAAGMFCLTASDGERQWWRAGMTEFLAATNRLVYASDEFGNVVVMTRDNGAVLGALPLREFPIRVANDRTDRLYLATESGRVVCIREQSQGYPLFHLYPERRPIVPEFAPDQPAAPPADAAEGVQ